MRILIIGLALLCFSTQAEARHRHHKRHHHHHHHYHPHHPHRNYVDQSGTQYLSHPNGCPRTSFCGCGAAVELFGRPIRSLWPSSAWFKFPRAYPGHQMAAVRRGHVFVLDRHVSGDVWWVKDYNSGGHRSRYHMRSIRGYTIVNPLSSRYAHHGVTL